MKDRVKRKIKIEKDKIKFINSFLVKRKDKSAKKKKELKIIWEKEIESFFQDNLYLIEELIDLEP